MDNLNAQKIQSKKPIIITVVGSILGLFVIWNLFFRTPAVDPVIQKVTLSTSNVVHPLLTTHLQAIVVLKGDTSVTGTVTFEQTTRTGPVKIYGQVKNLDPLSKRSFHIQ